mmetsp:Transcript_79873/g.231838  ORF Transcript_79873/g.231838 Transcript_79873/m.231838 type:complete len:336 (+) Transcript_79873:62-1069(+)
MRQHASRPAALHGRAAVAASLLFIPVSEKSRDGLNAFESFCEIPQVQLPISGGVQAVEPSIEESGAPGLLQVISARLPEGRSNQHLPNEKPEELRLLEIEISIAAHIGLVENHLNPPLHIGAHRLSPAMAGELPDGAEDVRLAELPVAVPVQVPEHGGRRFRVRETDPIALGRHLEVSQCRSGQGVHCDVPEVLELGRGKAAIAIKVGALEKLPVPLGRHLPTARLLHLLEGVLARHLCTRAPGQQQQQDRGRKQAPQADVLRPRGRCGVAALHRPCRIRHLRPHRGGAAVALPADGSEQREDQDRRGEHSAQVGRHGGRERREIGEQKWTHKKF